MITILIIVTVLIGNIWFLVGLINDQLRDIIRILEIIKENETRIIFKKSEQ